MESLISWKSKTNEKQQPKGLKEKQSLGEYNENLAI